MHESVELFLNVQYEESNLQEEKALELMVSENFTVSEPKGNELLTSH